ncbi:MAG TPA: hypothetical protein VE984_04155 [Gaiellaceae bacterium]|nr:hypothetical protein [Gaiellaceae bacterium]
MAVQVDESAKRPTPASTATLDEAGFVDFSDAGTPAAGEFRCTDCGYGAVVQRTLPPCPMCGGTVWERRESRAR